MTDEDRYARTVGKKFLPTCALVKLPETFVEGCASYIAQLFSEEVELKELVRLANAASKLLDGLFEENEPLRLLRRRASDSLAGGHFYESLVEAFDRGGGVPLALVFLAQRSVESLSDLLRLHPEFKKELACRQLLSERKAEVSAKLAAIFQAKCGLDVQPQKSTLPRGQEALLNFPIATE